MKRKRGRPSKKKAEQLPVAESTAIASSNGQNFTDSVDSAAATSEKLGTISAQELFGLVKQNPSNKSESSASNFAQETSNFSPDVSVSVRNTSTPKRRGRPRKKMDPKKSGLQGIKVPNTPGITLRISTHQGTPKIITKTAADENVPFISPQLGHRFKSPPAVNRIVKAPQLQQQAQLKLTPRLDYIIDRLKKPSQSSRQTLDENPAALLKKVPPVYQSGLISNYSPSNEASKQVVKENANNSAVLKDEGAENGSVLLPLDDDNTFSAAVEKMTEDDSLKISGDGDDAVMTTIPVSPPKNRDSNQPKIPKTLYTGTFEILYLLYCKPV